MGITGNLDTMELSELLQWLSQGKKTGTLVVVDQETAKQIYFRRGKIISAASSDPKEYLGHFLVRQGFIDEDQLAEAISRQEEEKALLGRILVDLELISEEDLDEMLRLKAEEGIYDLFTWERGEFRFLDDDLPEYDMVPISIDVTGIILEATRRLDQRNRIRSVIPSKHAVPVILSDESWKERTADPELDAGERRILRTVDDARTIEEIALEAHASEHHVSQVLYPLAREGHLKVVHPRTVTEETGELETGPWNAEDLAARGMEHLDEGRFEKALRHLRAAESLEPDDPRIKETRERGERSVLRQLEEEGIVPSATPRLARSLEELSLEEMSPKAGFLLSRMDGSYDLGSILKISPMAPLEARLVVWELLRAGHVRLE